MFVPQGFYRISQRQLEATFGVLLRHHNESAKAQLPFAYIATGTFWHNQQFILMLRNVQPDLEVS
jgi:hypothetical protein